METEIGSSLNTLNDRVILNTLPLNRHEPHVQLRPFPYPSRTWSQYPLILEQLSIFGVNLEVQEVNTFGVELSQLPDLPEVLAEDAVLHGEIHTYIGDKL